MLSLTDILNNTFKEIQGTLDNVNMSEEMIQTDTFRKRCVSYLISHIGTRQVVFGDIDLPNGSVVHMLDGFVRSIPLDNPPLYAFFNNLFGRPKFTNITSFDETLLEKHRSTARYYPANVNPFIVKLKKKLVKKFVVENSIHEVYAKKFKHLIANYLPISTLRMIGSKERVFAEYELLMTTVIDNINNSPEGSEHFICFPIVNPINIQLMFTYMTRDAVKIGDIELDRGQDTTLFFMLDWLTFLSGNKFENLPCMLDRINPGKRHTVHTMFISSDYSQTSIVNLGSMKELITNRSRIKTFFEYVNTSYKMVSPTAVDKTISDINELVQSGVNVGDEGEDSTTQLSSMEKVDDNNDVQAEIVVSDKLNENTQVEEQIITVIKGVSPRNPKEKRTETPVDLTTKETDNKELENLEDPTIDLLETEIELESQKLDTIFDNLVLTQTQTLEEVLGDIETNSKVQMAKQDKDYAEKVNFSQHISNRLNDTLNRDDQLTPKQKERANVLMQKTMSTNVTINGKTATVSQVLDSPSVKPVELQELPVDNSIQLDKTLNRQTVDEYNNTYREEILDKDIIATLVSFSQNGLFLSEYQEEVENDSFNRIRHVTAKFDSSNGKRHTVRFKIPISGDVMIINGIKYNLRMQQVNLPICRVSDTRVSLVSNFNKTLVEKVSYLRRSISNSIQKTLVRNPVLHETYKVIIDSNVYKGKRILPSDYADVANNYTLIENKDYVLYFRYDDVYTYFSIDDATRKVLDDAYTKYNLVFIGKSKKNKDHLLFMNVKTNLVHELNMVTKKDVQKRGILQFVFPSLAFDDVMPQPTEYCHLKILDKNIPIVAILGYRYGLLNILKEKGIKYRLIPKRQRVHVNEGDIVIPFKDYNLVFNRYPLTVSLLLTGLSLLETKEFTFAEMDHPATYYELFRLKGIKTNYLKGINSFFDFFVDPITFDVLKSMGEPVTPKGLLLRAIEMLSESKYVEASEVANARFRGDEKIPAVLYNEVSRQYSQYLNDKRRDTTFSINTEAVFQRIVQDNAVVLNEDVNPMHELKTKTSVTHLGFGGRTEEAFVEADRKFPRDGLGVVSESTPDSGKVALNFNIPPNAKITNTRGMVQVTEDVDTLDPSSILSSVGLTVPGTIHND